jgi:hypothetical protein
VLFQLLVEMAGMSPNVVLAFCAGAVARGEGYR